MTEKENPFEPVKEAPVKKAKPRPRNPVRRSLWANGDARYSYDPEARKGHGPFNLTSE